MLHKQNSGKPKVLVVAAWYPDPQSPTRTPFIERDAHLISNNNEVKVLDLSEDISYSQELTELWNGIEVTRIHLSRTNPFKIITTAFKIRKHIQQSHLVHSMAFSSLLPLTVLRLLGLFKKPWVHTEHWSGIMSEKDEMNLSLRSLLHSLKAPNLVIAVSKELKSHIDVYRTKRPTTIIPNLVIPPKELIARRAETQQPKLVFVGNLIDGKDPLLAVDVIKELHNRNVQAHLEIIGVGQLKSVIEERVTQHNLDNFITLTGAVLPQNIYERLHDNDFFFVPTKKETFFLACAEALAAGRPVIVGAHGAHAEYVSEPYGYLVKTQTPEAYADAIERAITETTHLSAEDIANTITRKFGPAQIAPQLQAIYEKLLG